ncbi:hypothetical protein [Trabulsiella odontotermitis]|uniref:hypothetical protein n=1 Tax=Trabulsiella odontotermitis TaxID=379893 RepID=UPI0006BA56C8|nr:hypothetical protein [Trabulsiella odontotermitis]
MHKLTFEYPAIKIKQNEMCSDVVLFGASAYEIRQWAGVPQKKSFDDVETVGFQRVDNKARLSELKKFYLNQQNVVQNTLICAMRDIAGCSVNFKSKDGNDVAGVLEIEFPSFYEMPIIDLFGILRQSLESRLHGKVNLSLSEEEKQELKKQLSVANESMEIESEGFSIPEDVYDDREDLEEAQGSDQDSLIFDESHIADFIKEIALRHEILKENPGLYKDRENFLGFSKESLISFILPVSLVDGQHRLLGAISEISSRLENGEFDDELSSFIDSGIDAPMANDEILKRHTRILPVSLLMSESPSEQVFQFVVINQKATPIGRSLLGTIVSTTLTNDEMEVVSQRLMDSGIQLEEARAITWMARNPASPFANLVERGVNNDSKEMLQWSVMGKIINIFKELKGGILFGERNDYAKIWQEKYLASSGVVADFEDYEFSSQYDYWRSLEGPWRKIFVCFWNRVSNKLAQRENNERKNFWGAPRESNIFNKISLMILSSDFFQYLVEIRSGIDSTEHLEVLVDEWLQEIKPAYFDRDWELSGVKKDSKGIRDRWAQLWSDYRKNSSALPQIRMYRNPKKTD